MGKKKAAAELTTKKRERLGDDQFAVPETLAMLANDPAGLSHMTVGAQHL